MLRSVLLLLLLTPTLVVAQESGQTVRGVVTDRDTRVPLIGATVVVVDSDPLQGASTDAAGRFVLQSVPLGRQTLQVRYLGYELRVLPNVLVHAGQETVLGVALQEQVVEGSEVVVQAVMRDGQPLNDMAAVSARSFSVEETRRYAGAVDDPARLAAAFAGVVPSGTGVQDNALSIRGNAPKGVSWRLEGVPIPNPNHFAGFSVVGGGALTLFSSQLLADSDVFTGAFPAEYGNALAGVFDMHFRTGNPATREHSAQVGVLGVEAAFEGPFRQGAPSTYLMNYRYSTLGLVMPLLPIEGGVAYQDLAFKLAFPTHSAGRFEVWGLGGLDSQSGVETPDSSAWTYEVDRTRYTIGLGAGAGGVTHHLVLGDRTYLRTTAAVMARDARSDQDRLDDSFTLQPDLRFRSTDGRFLIGTTIDHKFSPRHVNRTGVSIQRLLYDLDLQVASDHQLPVAPVAQGDGSSTLTEVFTQSRITPMPGLTLNLGLHAQRFALTSHTAVEPRLGLTWAVSDHQSVRIGYGLHSQTEDLRVYLVRPDGATQPNRNLGFARAHHLVVGTTRQVSETVRVQIEGYAQRLFNVPVVADSSFSLLNVRQQDWTFAEALVNEGAGENVGVDVALEWPLRDGVYALLTGSLFRSRYRGGDRVWRPTRFDQRYAVNGLVGRELRVGAHNLLGMNVRLAALGGERRSPVDEAASVRRGEVVTDESHAFEARQPPVWVMDLTLTYRVNGRRVSQVWALQLKNALAAKDAALDYDLRRQTVVAVDVGYPLPILSYKIEW